MSRMLTVCMPAGMTVHCPSLGRQLSLVIIVEDAELDGQRGGPVQVAAYINVGPLYVN